jgi:hypothetical protein
MTFAGRKPNSSGDYSNAHCNRSVDISYLISHINKYHLLGKIISIILLTIQHLDYTPIYHFHFSCQILRLKEQLMSLHYSLYLSNFMDHISHDVHYETLECLCLTPAQHYHLSTVS